MSITTQPTLSRNDAALLSAVAGQPHGRIALSKTMTPLTVKRTLGRLLKRGFIVASEAHEAAGETGHELTPAGYEAVGMTSPALVHPAVTDDAATPTPMSKREHVLALLKRAEGASLAELIAATGWLPHTTRAALSRLRSAGQVLDKTKRADGATAYRILPEVPAPPPRSGRRSARGRSGETQAVAD